MKQKTIELITKPKLKSGFLGNGHSARELLLGKPYTETNPFIILMDDEINISGSDEPVGGAHPHAGFETATLTVYNHGGGTNRTGTFELLTAGKGVVHTEATKEPIHMRILQLWIALPKSNRFAEPLHQEITEESVPQITNDGITIRVYSGKSQGIISPIKNKTPFNLIDFKFDSIALATQIVPGNHTTFIIMLDGEVEISGKRAKKDEVVWFSREKENDDFIVKIQSISNHSRLIFYSGKPQEDSIVVSGPFVGDHKEDIIKFYDSYHSGEMPHLNEIDDKYKISYNKEDK